MEQADVLVLVFTCVRDCEICFQGMVFRWFLWHVLPVPSFIAVCLSGGVLAWDGLKRKGGFVGGGGLSGSSLLALFSKLCSVYP